MASHSLSLVSPLTPPHRHKTHSTAPRLQRAGHASLTYQSPPRFSVASSGLLSSPTSPFDEPEPLADISVSFQQKRPRNRALQIHTTDQVNPNSPEPALVNQWSKPVTQGDFAVPPSSFGFGKTETADLSSRGHADKTFHGRSSQASQNSEFSTGRSEHTGELSSLYRRSGLSETSRTILTQFPLPPRLHQPASSSSTQGTSNEPKTPTIFVQQHYRTPDIELQYLKPTSGTESSLSPSKLGVGKYSLPKPPPRPEKPLPSLPQMNETGLRTTPPRAIFQDFTTAYQSIKSKSARDLYDVSSIKDLPLPPVPAEVREAVRLAKSESSRATTAKHIASSVEQHASRSSAGLRPRSPPCVHNPEWSHNEKLFLDLLRSRPVRRKHRAIAMDGYARFSMPAVSSRYRTNKNSFNDNVNLLATPSDIGSSLSSSPNGRDSDHDSHSTSVGSHDSAEDFIDSYIDDGAQRAHISRRYSAMPRLQHVQTSLSDVTTSTIGDLLSHYGDPEFRSLPTSISQRLQTVDTAQNRVNDQDDDVSLEQTSSSPENVPVGATLLDHAPRYPFSEQNNLQSIRRPESAMIADPHLVRHSPFIELGRTLVDSTPLIDYGDTKDLLELSSSSIHIGRGNAPSKSNRFSLARGSSSDQPLLYIRNSVGGHSASGHSLVQGDSDPFRVELDEDGLVQANVILQPFSAPDIPPSRTQERISGDDIPSGLRANLLDTRIGKKSNTNPFRRDHNPGTIQTHEAHPVDFRKPSLLSQYLEEQRADSQLNFHDSLQNHSSAASAPINVIRGVHRSSPSQLPTLTSKHGNAEQAEELIVTAPADVSGNEEDWETTTESRRTGPGHGFSSRSLASPSDENAFRPINSVGIHPADQRYRHVYRLHSPPGSAESVLIPSYDLGNLSHFPYQNSSRLAARFEVVHDQPMVDAQDHRGITSQSTSPIVTSTFSQTTLESISFDDEDEDEDDRPVPYGVWRGPNLSVVYEQSGERSETELAIPPQPVVVPQILGDGDRSSAWVDRALGPEVSSINDASAWQHDGPSGLYTTNIRSTISASGAETNLISDLRTNDGASSMSATNSFAKTTKLGPLANLTGSFNGTNARFVGSSVIDSSTLAGPASKSVQQTPNRLEAQETGVQSTLLLAEQSSSSSSWHRPRSYMIPRDKWLQGIPKPRNSSEHAVKILSTANDSRVAVASQKALLVARAAQGHPATAMGTSSRLREPSRGGNQIIAFSHSKQVTAQGIPAEVQNRTPDTLLPLANPHAQLLSPHLHRMHRVPSSQVEQLKSTKHKISWLVFAVLALFPPLLIFYGHNLFEPLMLWLTRGKIEHFGRRPKQVGKAAGYFLTGAILLGLAVALIVIRTVPNSLPK